MITTKSEIENYLLTTIDASFNTQVDKWIKAMQTYIESLANRSILELASKTYRYTGNNAHVLFVDDFTEITEVKIGGTTLPDTEYVAKPFNLTYVNQLRYVNGSKWSGAKEGDIEITGKKGMFAEADVPEDLRFACTVLVAGIVQASSNENKEIQSETIGRYSVSYKTDTQKVDYKNALEIARSYRRVTI